MTILLLMENIIEFNWYTLPSTECVPITINIVQLSNNSNMSSEYCQQILIHWTYKFSAVLTEIFIVLCRNIGFNCSFHMHLLCKPHPINNIYKYIYIHIYTHIYVYTHTRTYTHIPARLSSALPTCAQVTHSTHFPRYFLGGYHHCRCPAFPSIALSYHVL